MNHLIVLGSTGSIGTQTLQIVREQKNKLNIIALAAGKNVTTMESQIREFHPKYAVMWDENAAKDLKQRVSDLEIKVLHGMEGLLEISVLPEADTLVAAVVGMIGIRPTIAAMKAGKKIALANKETLVTAGHIIMPLSKELNIPLLPVDSEHSAIFQCLNGENKNQIKKLLLTASGGPFRGMTKEQMAHVQVEDALKHPNWAMGQKITIDSATMVNKGLEVMEAGWLFDVGPDEIEVVVQPQSIIHSMVEYVDGSVIAQMGLPDMKLPIQYALFYPNRIRREEERIDFSKIGQITFESPDLEVFTGLKLAFEAFRAGGSMPTVYNAANEKAVSLFLERKIEFLKISEIIGASMDKHKKIENPTLDEILAAELECYEFIESRWT